MLLRSLKLTNFLSFGPSSERIELRDLNVLIGPNGSGKSNFIEAIGILQAAPTDLGRPLVESRSVESWRWRGNGVQADGATLSAVVELNPQGENEPLCLRHEVTFSNRGTRFALLDERVINHSEDGNDSLSARRARVASSLRKALDRIERGRKRRAAAKTFDAAAAWGRLVSTLEIRRTRRERELSELADRLAVSEYFAFRGDSARIVERPLNASNVVEKEVPRSLFDEDLSVLAQLRDPERYPGLRGLSQAYEAIAIYREWTFGRGSPVRLPQSAALPDKRLFEDGRNLGLVLKRISEVDEVRAQLVERLAVVFEGIRDVKVDIVRNTVHVALVDSTGWVWSDRLSDGTMRWLMLLAILFDPSPPALVCIEEPELGLHPDMIPTVAELLKDASSRTQIVVTTHSEVLVDALSGSPEDVLVCERNDGSTTVRRLDASSLAEWLKEYRLGQLWSKGVIGGNRW